MMRKYTFKIHTTRQINPIVIVCLARHDYDAFKVYCEDIRVQAISYSEHIKTEFMSEKANNAD